MIEKYYCPNCNGLDYEQEPAVLRYIESVDLDEEPYFECPNCGDEFDYDGIVDGEY